MNILDAQWRLNWGYRALAGLPGALPWRLAGLLGEGSLSQRRGTRRFLRELFGQLFPHESAARHGAWADAHLNMLAQEKVDSMAFDRLGNGSGASVQVDGENRVHDLAESGQGFILVLNHFDRLLTAPVALAHRGVVTHVLTMPVLENPQLTAAQRGFLMRKIGSYVQITKGGWRTTGDDMRPVLRGLKEGQAWVILADAWNENFGRMREHPFLGGYLNLPTGIERLARSAQVPLLYAATHTVTPNRLRVVVEQLPADPGAAVDRAVARLEQDVRERPWAWWQWGLWERMWRPAVHAPARAGDEC